MPFGRKKNLDASSKRKTKHKKMIHRRKQATPSPPSEPNTNPPPSEPNAATPPLNLNPSDQPTWTDSMSTLTSEHASRTREEETVCPSSSDSEDVEIGQFQDDKSCRIDIAFQRTDICKHPPKEQ